MITPCNILSARILIVDDQDVNVRLLQRLLADAGYSQVSATTLPAEVCALHRHHDYDLILLDLQMPGMDGLTALPRLRQLCPDAVIAAHSFDGEALERAMALGADLSVAKGSGLEELLNAIAIGRETRRQLQSSEKNNAA